MKFIHVPLLCYYKGSIWTDAFFSSHSLVILFCSTYRTLIVTEYINIFARALKRNPCYYKSSICMDTLLSSHSLVILFCSTYRTLIVAEYINIFVRALKRNPISCQETHPNNSRITMVAYTLPLHLI